MNLSQISTSPTVRPAICTVFAPCPWHRQGLRLSFVAGAAAGPRVAPNFGQFWQAETRVPQGSLELSTGKSLCLVLWCWKRQQNTRCCGFLLTYTTNRGTFSSAAFKTGYYDFRCDSPTRKQLNTENSRYFSIPASCFLTEVILGPFQAALR